MDFGRLLERFWVDFGPKSNAKLGPKSERWRPQDDVRKCVVKVSRRCTRVYASVPKRGGRLPIINQSNLQGQHIGH